MSNAQHQLMEKIELLTRQLRIAEETGNKALEGNTHEALGLSYKVIGRNMQAKDHHEKYLKIAKQMKDKRGEGNAHNHLGDCYVLLSQYDNAVKHCKMALDIAKEIGNKVAEGSAMGNLGNCYLRVGQYAKAIEHYQMHLNVAKQIGDKAGEGSATGNLGNCYRCLAEYDKAIQHYEMHLNIAKQLGDKGGEGSAIGNLGNCYLRVGQYNKAIEHYKMHLNIAKQIGNKASEGRAIGNLGNCYRRLGRYDIAIEHYEMHLNIAKETRDKASEGIAIGNLGNCYRRLGQYDKAIEHYELHLNIAKQIGDKPSEGINNGNLGLCYQSLGQYDKAIEHFEIHLNIAKQIGDKASEGSAIGNLGNCYRCLGRYDKALEHYEMHLSIVKQIGDKAGEGSAKGNLGNCYQCLGHYDKAIEHYEMHLKITKHIGDKAGEGSNMGNLGLCYQSLGEYVKAKEHHETHLKIAKQIGDKAGEGRANGNLGSCYLSLGQYDKAIEHYEMHLNIAKQIGDKAGEGRAIGDLGNSYQFLGQYEQALKYLEMQLKFAQQLGDNKSEAVAYNNLGICCYSLGQYDKAEEYYKESLESYEKLFKNVPQQDQYKVSIVDTFIKTYRQLVAILLRQEKKEEALVIAERGRSRALSELLVNARDSERQTNVPEAKGLELDEILQVVKALDSTVIFFALFKHGLCTWVIQRDGNDINVFPQDRNCVLADFSTSRPRDLLSLIGKATQLLSPSGIVTCEDRSLSFMYPDESKQTTNKRRAILPSAIDPAEIPVAQMSLQCDRTPNAASMQRKQAAMTQSSPSKNRQDMEESELNSVLQDLFQILLNPVRQLVKGSQVVVVPDGPLPLVPFAALISGDGHYVADTLQVRLVPSLATGKMIMEQPQESEGQTSPLIVGDPEVDQVQKGEKTIPVKRLPFAKEEAEMVGQLLNVKPLIAERATKESFLQNVERANLIHIAAHGDMEKGEILLAPSPGNPSRKFEDVMLTITDLEHKHLRAKLVVLSCCHSGRGKVRAEGVIGIGRAFLGAGARAVLVTLWAVDDEATKYFMRKFYQHLICGERANEALNRAMKAMKETEMFQHPRYWAPFVLIGEDVAPFDDTVSTMQP